MTPEKQILRELGVDSVDFLDIAYEIEQRTGYDVATLFEDAEPSGDLTIQGLVDVLQAKLS